MIPENLMPPIIPKIETEWKDPFNFFPTDGKKKPNYRISYIYTNTPECCIMTDSPAIFNSDEKAVKTAEENAGKEVRTIKVDKYTKRGLINIKTINLKYT